MNSTETQSSSVFELMESLEVGGSIHDHRATAYVRRKQSEFNKAYPDRHVSVMQSKTKEGKTIILRVE